MQKVTLIDYPGKVGCTLFTYGCNFKCPFCHNPELVIDKWSRKVTSDYKEDKVMGFLESRKGKLDAVTVTGGEPLLWDQELLLFLQKIKNMGYHIKLDTNGSFPERIRKFISKRVVDYWAMDIKNSLDGYEKSSGSKLVVEKVVESINLIKDSGIDYEFRTTVVPGFHDNDSIDQIGKLLDGASRFYIQNFNPGKTIDHNLNIKKGFNSEKLEQFKNILSKYIKEVFIRNN